MGKLGARELNVSSDIDLIYVYEHDGDTAGIAGGRGRISNHEYFARAVKAIYSLMGDTTEHGFVFRVDLALRPNGNSRPGGRLAVGAGRVLAGAGPRVGALCLAQEPRAWRPASCIGSPKVQALRGGGAALRLPPLPGLQRVRRAAQRCTARSATTPPQRSAGHPERANDVKLSRGGIREIEFTVQLLQVVRGGQFPELRCRPTLEALQRLAQRRPDAAGRRPTPWPRPTPSCARWSTASSTWTTSKPMCCPPRDDDLAWIAQHHGLCRLPAAFLHAAGCPPRTGGARIRHPAGRRRASKHCNGGGCGGPQRRRGASGPNWKPCWSNCPQRLRAARGRVAQPRRACRACATKPARACSGWCSAPPSGCAKAAPAREAAAVRLIDWLEPLLRRESYLALLLERPPVHEQPAAPAGRRQVAGALPAAAPRRDRRAGRRRAAGRALVRGRLRARTGAAPDSAAIAPARTTTKPCSNLLRRAHHAETFRTLARDVEGAPHGGAGGRRPERPGRQRAARRPASGAGSA